MLGDQLSFEHAALAAAGPNNPRVLMLESKARDSVHRYHQIKLVVVYSARRHFAAGLRRRGWTLTTTTSTKV
ncbi:MAG: cryptochrome/photolyase family protein [Chthoniobacterales bacterium]